VDGNSSETTCWPASRSCGRWRSGLGKRSPGHWRVWGLCPHLRPASSLPPAAAAGGAKAGNGKVSAQCLRHPRRRRGRRPGGLHPRTPLTGLVNNAVATHPPTKDLSARAFQKAITSTVIDRRSSDSRAQVLDQGRTTVPVVPTDDDFWVPTGSAFVVLRQWARQRTTARFARNDRTTSINATASAHLHRRGAGEAGTWYQRQSRHDKRNAAVSLGKMSLPTSWSSSVHGRLPTGRLRPDGGSTLAGPGTLPI